MEFFGDVIFGFCVCDLFYCCFFDYFEGDLMWVKFVVVSCCMCVWVSWELCLGDFLIVGKGMMNNL